MLFPALAFSLLSLAFRSLNFL